MQGILPFIPSGSTSITEIISVVKEKQGQGIYWRYYCGFTPVFIHLEKDTRSFRMFASQLVCTGECKQVDIVRAFGVSAISVKRNVKKFKHGGVEAFYRPRTKRSSHVLTPEVLKKAQEYFDQGCTRRQVADKVGVKYDTLKKAIYDLRLHENNIIKPDGASTKSERSILDAGASMGTGCRREIERMLVATGKIVCAATKFENCRDVSFAGVLCAVPALLANGLFDFTNKYFVLPNGFYNLAHIMLLLSYMALCRIKSNEALRFHPPGEIGKLIGLDRIPEVKTLRDKLSIICSEESRVQKWSLEMSRKWMNDNKELAGVLYVDGHVKVYHGKKTKLPKRYISRQRLCLRGITDYWVNDCFGQPFFLISRQIDKGLLEVLRKDIVPRLIRDVPGQPTEQELKKNPYLHRFIIVFDREGYSPGFFKQMWEKYRIACISYHKYPKEDWPCKEFQKYQCRISGCESVEMDLAERGTLIGSKKKDRLWVKQIRKLTKSGHQTSIISTAYLLEAAKTAPYMFSRWSQENFFKYAMQHYDIDRLTSYETESFPDTTKVVNPEYRTLENRIRTIAGKLTRTRAEFGNICLELETENKKVEKYLNKKGELMEEIKYMEQEIENLKNRRSKISRTIEIQKLPGEEMLKKLDPAKKKFVDIIKMVAYRSETAMAMQVKEVSGRQTDARPIVRELMRQEADIIPDDKNKTLIVQVHRMANPQSNRAVQYLLDNLNETQTVFPQTNLKLHYRMVGADP